MDMVMITETGCNKENSLWTTNDNFDILKEIKMKEIPNSKYQHVGAGTALLGRENITHQPTRRHFNSEKYITEIIRIETEDK